jgi:CubicO group peptidase (beta-lactamase class C family)
MIKKFILLLCALSLFLPTQVFSRVKSLDSLKNNLLKISEKEMSQWDWTGLSVAVVYKNKIVINKGFGYANIENNIPVTKNTVFPIASLTKTFTATMFMQLREKSLVEFYSNVNTLVPEYKPLSDTNYGYTILLQLATHSSGLPKDPPVMFWSHFEDFLWIILNGNFEKQTKVNREEFLKSLSSVRLVTIPNASFNYSNTGYILLGMALEKASGMSYQEYIKKYIFKPLEMKNSGFYSDFIETKNQAMCYAIFPQNTEPIVTPINKFDDSNSLYISAGGIYSTSEDIAKFLIFQINGNPNVLKGENLRLMQKKHYGGYGIGWDINKIDNFKALSHAGGGLGLNSYMIAIPEAEIGVVILRNCSYPYGTEGSIDKLAVKLVKECIAWALENDKDFDKTNVPNNLQRYTGNYKTSLQNATAIITIKDNKINMQLKEAPDFNETFLPINPLEFHFQSDPSKKPMLFFQEDEKGNITGLSFLSFLFYKD